MKRPLIKAAAVTAGLSLGLLPVLRSHNANPEIATGPVPEISAPPLKPKAPGQTVKAISKVIVPELLSAPLKPTTPEIIQSQIIPRLGEFGLKPVQAEQGVNGPDEFMVQVNDRCGSQFRVDESDTTPGLLNVSATVFGRLSLLKRFTKVAGFPEFDNRLAHQEGALMEGQDFNPTNPESLSTALDYMAKTAVEVCHNQGLLGKL